MSLMYQEICCLDILSGIIKNMKIEPRNKWRKVDSMKIGTSLDTSSLLVSIKTEWRILHTSSKQARSIEIYDFRILISELRPMMTWIARISFTKPLNHIKTSF